MLEEEERFDQVSAHASHQQSCAWQRPNDAVSGNVSCCEQMSLMVFLVCVPLGTRTILKERKQQQKTMQLLLKLKQNQKRH